MASEYMKQLERIKKEHEDVKSLFVEVFGKDSDKISKFKDDEWLIKQAELFNGMEKKNKSMHEALDFYAQHDNWWTYPVPGGYASAASVDKGDKARREIKLYESK